MLFFYVYNNIMSCILGDTGNADAKRLLFDQQGRGGCHQRIDGQTKRVQRTV